MTGFLRSLDRGEECDHLDLLPTVEDFGAWSADDSFAMLEFGKLVLLARECERTGRNHEAVWRKIKVKLHSWQPPRNAKAH